MLKILGLLAQLWAREEYTRVTEIELPAVAYSVLDLSNHPCKHSALSPELVQFTQKTALVDMKLTL